MMDLPFKPEAPIPDQLIGEQICMIENDPVIDSLMEIVEGSLAILNSKRQIIALNKHLLKHLGVTDVSKALGLRLGEVVSCIHADEPPGGCGTTEYCSSCGAAIAMMTTLSKNEKDERTCIVKRDDPTEPDIMLNVKSAPFRVGDENFLLIFFKDITREQKRAALERTFFHDVSNVLTGLSGASQLLSETGNNEKLLKLIQRSSQTLCKEVEIQKYLVKQKHEEYKPEYHEIHLNNFCQESRTLCSTHPACKGKALNYSFPEEDLSFFSDSTLCHRIISNMIINAMEASSDGDIVEVNCGKKDKNIYFKVLNKQIIPDDVKLRIFQRNFSTKGTNGRGLGTFSMKLFGEEVLGGKVSFTSKEGEGTCFQIELPLTPDALCR